MLAVITIYSFLTSLRVNAVDVLYASMPIYIYLQPEILGLLLEPLLDAQENDLYTEPYAAIDLGSYLALYYPKRLTHGCRGKLSKCDG